MKNLLVHVVIILCLGIFYSTPSPAPVEVGNGGDAVDCAVSTLNELNGFYALDYLVNFNTHLGSVYFDATDRPAYEKILQALQANHADVLALSLKGFLDNALRQILHAPDFAASETWVEAELVDIPDEHLFEKVPLNCSLPSLTGIGRQVKLTQAVERTERSDMIIYKYDKAVFQALIANPVQFSFLLIHEWLWARVETADQIRDVNQFLHTKSTYALSPSVFMQTLIRKGVTGNSFDWLNRITHMAWDQSQAKIGELRSCQFDPVVAAHDRTWLLTNREQMDLHLQTNIGWMGDGEPNDPCFDWSRRPDAGPLMDIETCFLSYGDIDSARQMMMSTLIQALGGEAAFAERAATVLWRQVDAARCR